MTSGAAGRGDPHAFDAREQTQVREFFGGARSGFFVEVGANHPQFASQTWHLEQLGWTGVLVEPQPDLADNLRRHRTARVFAVACSSQTNAGQQMKFHVAGALSSLEPDRMAPGAELQRVIEVPIRTLDDVLIEAQAPVPIDLVSLDVEGHELQVLDGFTPGRWKPRLILMEDHVGDLSKHRFLSAQGYRLIRRVENNGWYVPGDAVVGVTPRQRWEILRKYYLALPFRMLRNVSRRLRQPLKDRLRARRRAAENERND